LKINRAVKFSTSTHRSLHIPSALAKRDRSASEASQHNELLILSYRVYSLKQIMYLSTNLLSSFSLVVSDASKIPVALLKFTRVGVAMSPVGTSSSLVKVLDSGDQVLVHPWIIRILDSVLLADFTNSGSNVRIPSRTHTWKQMMLHLEVESSSEVSRNETSVS
jgi:hypothetical protein